MTRQGNSILVANVLKHKGVWARASYDIVRPSVFRVYSHQNCDVGSFCGTAWKYDDHNLLTCWHVIGEVQERSVMRDYGERVPTGPPHRRRFYAKTNGQTYTVEPMEHRQDLDFCVLHITTPCPVPRLSLNDEGSSMGDHVWTFAYSSGCVPRFAEGTYGSRLPDSREKTANMFTDHCMSGGPIFDVRGRVVGMITGGIGDKTLVTRFLPIDLLVGFIL